MPDVSAVILSKAPVERVVPGCAVVPFISTFSEVKGLLNARIASLEAVDTEWFFWLDDDDELPDDFARVLAKCLKVKTPLAYTDELITNADGTMHRRQGAKYTQDRHIDNMTLIHHLAVCKTEVARAAAKRIPRGMYAVENLLFFEVAKQGATYINEIGYVWHRRKTGLNADPSLTIGLVQSAIWANRNRGTA